MKLRTKRLVLRDITMKDTKSLVENINNLKVTRYLLVVPYPYKLKDAKEWINRCKKKVRKKRGEDYNFSIQLKSGKGIIGAVGLHHVDKYQGTAEIGFWLGKKYWQQGIMSEAVGKVIDFAFNKLKLRRIEAGVFKENKPSFKLLEKFKFKREGMKKQSRRAKSTGKIHDEYIYGILKSEHKKKK